LTRDAAPTNPMFYIFPFPSTTHSEFVLDNKSDRSTTKGQSLMYDLGTSFRGSSVLKKDYQQSVTGKKEESSSSESSSDSSDSSSDSDSDEEEEKKKKEAAKKVKVAPVVNKTPNKKKKRSKMTDLLSGLAGDGKNRAPVASMFYVY